MIALSSVALLLFVTLSHGLTTTGRTCPTDNVDFKTKVQNSTIVVYGKSMAKTLNEGSDSVFHISFQVDCILKGPPTARQINITNTGRVPGRQYCQEFPVGRGYSVAFLEPVSTTENDPKTFTPTDFVEIVNEGKLIEDLLRSTCSLTQRVPLNSIATVAEICPSVSTAPECQTSTSGTVPETTTVVALTQPKDTESSKNETKTNEESHLSKPVQSPEPELDAIRAKSGQTQVNVDQKSAANKLCWNLILLSLIAFLLI